MVYAGGHWLKSGVSGQERMTSEGNTIKDIVGNSWEKPGDIAKYPFLVGENYYFDHEGNPSATRTQFNFDLTSRHLYKADYLRLRNLQLGYSLPAKMLRKVNLSTLRIYAGVANLFTITSYPGYDPETNNDLPIPRTFNFGLSINL